MYTKPKGVIPESCATIPAACAWLGIALLAGCGDSNIEELGEIHYRLPRIHGMELPYHLPPRIQVPPATGEPSPPVTDAPPSQSPEVGTEEALRQLEYAEPNVDQNVESGSVVPTSPTTSPNELD